MHASPIGVTSLLLLAILTRSVSGQTPDPAPARDGRRLVYELPMDALQRTLQHEPNSNLEQCLDRVVRTVAARVGGEVIVQRHAATGFTVDVPPKLVPQTAALRRRIEAAGKLEMRIVADADYRDGAVRFDLATERTRLDAWLDEGGRERLLADARALDAFHADPKTGPAAGANLRWFVRRIHRNPEAMDRWDVSFLQFPQLDAACVPAYTKADWNEGVVPARILALPEGRQFLTELVAVNMHEVFFANSDLDVPRLERTDGPPPALSYAIVVDRAADYACWTEKYIGKACAILWNDEVRTAPVFRNKIRGAGMISGGFEPAELDDLEITLKSGPLPVPPKFVAEEPLPASEFRRPTRK